MSHSASSHSTRRTGVPRVRRLLIEQLEDRSLMSADSVATPDLPADAAVEYRLEAEDLGGHPISAVEVGQDFQLAAFVRDLRSASSSPSLHFRPTQGGVFAGWIDVTYDDESVSIPADSSFSYGSFFTLERSGDLSLRGQITNAGGSSTSITPPGTAEQLLWKLKMHASAAGAATFHPSFDSTLGQDTLLYGLNAKLIPTHIYVPAATLQLTILNADDEAASNGDDAAETTVSSGLVRIDHLPADVPDLDPIVRVSDAYIRRMLFEADLRLHSTSSYKEAVPGVATDPDSADVGVNGAAGDRLLDQAYVDAVGDPGVGLFYNGAETDYDAIMEPYGITYGDREFLLRFSGDGERAVLAVTQLESPAVIRKEPPFGYFMLADVRPSMVDAGAAPSLVINRMDVVAVYGFPVADSRVIDANSSLAGKPLHSSQPFDWLWESIDEADFVDFDGA